LGSKHGEGVIFWSHTDCPKAHQIYCKMDTASFSRDRSDPEVALTKNLNLAPKLGVLLLTESPLAVN